jgi:predicted O-methyltransferase YrrM
VRIIKPNVAVELGTCVGISGAYEAAALKLNGGGQLLTFEGADDAAHIAEDGFRALGLERHTKVIIGRFADTLPGVLQSITEPIAYVFIDGHHEEEATLNYYGTIAPRLARRALIVFDDIRWSEGMTRAWRTVCDDPAVQVAIDCGPVGICLRDPAAAPARFRISFV